MADHLIWSTVVLTPALSDQWTSYLIHCGARAISDHLIWSTVVLSTIWSSWLTPLLMVTADLGACCYLSVRDGWVGPPLPPPPGFLWKLPSHTKTMGGLCMPFIWIYWVEGGGGRGGGVVHCRNMQYTLIAYICTHSTPIYIYCRCTRSIQRIRTYTEKKAKVVATASGTELIKFLVPLAILH